GRADGRWWAGPPRDEFRREASSILASAREPETSVARAHVGLGQAQLATNDVGALDEGDALVIGDPSAQPLTAEAAVGGNHESLGRDVLQRFPDEAGQVLRRFYQGVAVADHADTDLLVGPVLRKEGQVHAACARALERDDVGVELEQVGEGTLIARRLPVHALLIGVSPAR